MNSHAGVLIPYVLLLITTEAARCQVPDAVEVQRVAISAAVARVPFGVVTKPRLALEPFFAPDSTAPGMAGLVARDTAEQRALIASVGAITATGRDVLACKQGHCVTTGADMLLTLSRPVFNGTEANLTTTLTTVTADGRLFYETMRWRLNRVGSIWRIVSAVQLGIS